MSSKVANNPTWLAVVAAAIRDDCGRILMQRRPAEKMHGGLWEFPGGKVEPTEMPAFALVREIREELGIGLDECNLLPCAFAEAPGQRGIPAIVILLYSVTDWIGTPQALEGGELGWFTKGEAAGLEKPPLDHELLSRLR